MADVTAQRAALAETRARIDAHLDELTDHVPDREHLRSTAMKYAGAAVGAVVGMVGLVIVTKSTLNGRRTRKEATSYATAVARALPEVINAWHGRAKDAVPTAVLDAASTIEPATATTTANRPASIDADVVLNPPRGGVGTALLIAAGVIGGVAAAQALNGNEAEGR